MTTHYSDSNGFISGETEGKSNGIAGTEAFANNGNSSVEEKEARNIRCSIEDDQSIDEHHHTKTECQAELTPDTLILIALRKLARACQFAVDCDRSRWDFAVEIADLDSLGVSHDELRWMIGKGLVEQAREIGDGNGIGRSFDSPGGFTFTQQSCFVLTASGLQLATELSVEIDSDHVTLPVSDSGRGKIQLLPQWDDQRHELRLGDVLVKRFKWRAANQEAILAAFHEEGWPARIDDPLPPVPETDPKRRLSDTIKCLNRKQQNSLVRFSGDGTGEGVLWDVVDRVD